MGEVIMSKARKIFTRDIVGARALLGLSLMMMLGAQVPMAAHAADEHEHPRPERAAPRPAAGRPDGPRGQVFDARYNHGRYYPAVGTLRPDLPVGYHPYFHGSDRFFFAGGVWYAPRGPGFAVVAPPVGLVIGVLPAYYSTVWFAGVPYYYADNVYYTQAPDQSGYVVSDPPPNADQPAPPPDAPPSAAQMDLIIYPKNGQSKDQQAADQYECHTWAKGQTGFDPTLPAGSGQPAGGGPGDPNAARANYNRAMSACLQARGYQVN
jgi:hypothetical protein